MSKILLIDTETFPEESYTWGRHNQFIATNQVKERSSVICYSAKWLDDEEFYYNDSIHNYKGWKQNVRNDKKVLETIWDLLDKADYVVAHNGDNFDISMLNTRFLIQGMQPPSTFQSIDTLKIARKHFRFATNKLEEIATVVLGKKKIETGGMGLWVDCLKGEVQALNLMQEYCDGDLFLLEEVYKKLRPFHTQHPHVFIDGSLEAPICSTCGSDEVMKNGYYTTNTQRYRKFKCKKCGTNMRHRKGESITRGNYNILKRI